MRVQLFGCPVDVLTMAETVESARIAMRDRIYLHHVALNAAKLVNLQRDSELAEDVKRSHIVGIDGMAIVLALKCFGRKNVERVAGIDLMHEVLAVCAKQGYRPFFLGARPEIVNSAAQNIEAQLPGLQFAGIRDGYFDQTDESAIVKEIQESGADCLFVGLPTPKKERFLAKYGETLGVPFIMGVGGSFDVAAGLVDRAPPFMQRYGLEWLYRTYQEPRRMWWRYARTNTVFAWMVLKGLLRQRLMGLSPVELPQNALR